MSYDIEEERRTKEFKLMGEETNLNPNQTEKTKMIIILLRI